MSVHSVTGVDQLLAGGEATALALTGDTEALTYAELSAAVADEADRLGPDRRVALLPMRNDVRSVVRLLGALKARHPVLLVTGDEAARHDDITTRYVHANNLHPDLALMLSTSGSTGSPKLVRLSHDNLAANARSIADYLDLTPGDRAITSLPLHYCYGLSVLTSHLHAGASVTLTDLSVADEYFWTLAQDTRASSFAGVPYTFDLLDNSGFVERDLPHLRYITQAGGRMDPAMVRRYANLGRERGFDLFVMYGQTEATARMAYLPPGLAADRPEAIGIPVPGGHFRLDPVSHAEPGVGELVYSGPNVMMGYAETAEDLARGEELTELRTGDLATQADDGLWEIFGRLDRNAKVFGLRLDLSHLESTLPLPTALVAHADELHAFIDRRRAKAPTHAGLVSATGLPPGTVHVHHVDRLPTNDRGKTDYAALRRHAESASRSRNPPAVLDARKDATPVALRNLYAVTLGRPDATVHDSFVELGGDSLSFVEVSIQLGMRLGHLPPGWQHLSPEHLAATARTPRLRWRTVPIEISVLLRAAAILLIVVSHTDLWIVMGGAHVLLALAGFSLARFTLPVAGRRARSDRLLATVAGVAVPASLWIAVSGRVSGDYELRTALFLNQLLGSRSWSSDWQFWFLEILVWSYLAIAVAIRIPALDRWQRRAPFGCAVLVTVAALLLRYAETGVAAEGISEYTIQVAFWCLALGWAAAEADNTRRRCLVALMAVVGTVGFFPEDTQRQAVLLAGVLALLVPRALPMPRTVAFVARHIAHASLWIYLTHWQIYPELEDAGLEGLAVIASLTVGIAACHAQALVRRDTRRLWARLQPQEMR